MTTQLDIFAQDEHRPQAGCGGSVVPGGVDGHAAGFRPEPGRVPAPGQFIDTRRAALEAIEPEAENLREQCLMLLQSSDYSADELATMLRRSPLAIRPRVAELHNLGLVRKSGSYHKNDSGRPAVVWTTRGQN